MMVIDAKPVQPGDARGNPLACAIGWHAWEDQAWRDPDKPSDHAIVIFVTWHRYRVCRCCHKTKPQKRT